jgi:outer membrane protein OmpA-like peptidoglycan-associated protein
VTALRRPVSIVYGCLLLSAVAFAESGTVNAHVEPGATIAFPSTGYAGTGFSGALKLDLPITGPLAVQGQGVLLALPRAVRAANIYGAGLGVRVRLLDDHKGSLFGGTGGGNWFGNLWFDGGLLLAGTSSLNRIGVDVGLGVESSLFEGLQVGPFVKFTNADALSMATLGLSLSFGADRKSGPEDTDKDGIMDPSDKCPTQAEDKDGFKDEDGCPDPDNDGDNIIDDRDKCPNEAEDKDGYEDEDGCPDKDNDSDGILDAQDQCPTDPEDKDGFQDEDGCPDKDNDNDGIEDTADKCPNNAEDKDGFQDDDGCPDEDNDKDGIPDAVDQCPMEAETYNGNADEDGCPEKEAKVFVTKDQVVITEKVYFAFNKATIEKRSNALLNSVADVFKKFPALKKVRVDGHTDDVGTDAKNQTLSEQRAKAVMDYLIKAGVEKERLESKGFGKSQPVDPAKTDEAREKNRRVEFQILEPQGGIIETIHKEGEPATPVQTPDAGTQTPAQ